VDFRNAKVNEANSTRRPQCEGFHHAGRGRACAGASATGRLRRRRRHQLEDAPAGDFTATARYEIIQAVGRARVGVGIEMYLTLDTPMPRDGIVFARVIHPGGALWQCSTHDQ